MKKFITVLLALFFIMCTYTYALSANKYIDLTLKYDGASHRYNAEEVFLNVDGSRLGSLTMPPIILNGYTLVPAREVFEKTGASVSWNSDREEVYVAKGSDLLVLKINSTTAYYNNSKVKMTIPAKLINSKTMIPVRFVSETLGYYVGWDNSTRTIEINSSGEAPDVTVAEKPAEITTLSAAAATEANEDYAAYKPASVSEELPASLIMPVNESYGGYSLTAVSVSDTYLKIDTNGQIGKIEKDTVGSNRYYIDFYNCSSSIGKVEFGVSVGGISNVRIAQRSEGGTNITRLAMDVSDFNFNIRLSSDKKIMYIYYTQPVISDYKLVSDTAEDIFTIMGRDLEKPDVVNTDNYITVTFKNTKLTAAEQTLKKNGFITSSTDIKASGNNCVITFSLKEAAKYKTEADSSKFVITLYEPPYKNIDVTADTLTLNKNGASIDINGVNVTDDYQNLKYTITLPGDFSGTFGTGDVAFDSSERLNSVNISVSGGKTTLVFDEKIVSAFDISQDSTNLYIKCMAPGQKYDKVVVIDAGHGGTDAGAVANGYYEKDLTLQIVLKIKKLIEADGTIKAYFTRTGDTYPTLGERADFGNAVDAPFVSVHINSVSGNITANGIEVFYQYENENENGLTSTKLAQTIYDNLIEYTGATKRGVKSNDLKVLRDAKNPATLIECGFITNPLEAGKMASDEYQEKLAKAVFDALKELL